MASRSPAPLAASAPPEEPRPRAPHQRLRRWLGLGLGALLALAFAVALGLWLLLAELEHPWVKARLLALCRDRLGLGVDYEGLEVSLRHGVRARSLRLLTPPALATAAADCVHVEGFELRFAPWRFALGQRSIEALTIARVELSLVQDASGRSTLSELFPDRDEPEPRPQPHPSQLLAELPELTIDALEVGSITLRQIQIGSDGVRSSLSLAGLHASGALHSEGHGLAGSTLALGADPLEVELAEGERVRRATLGLHVELAGSGESALTLRGRVELRTQDWVPSAPSGELLALEARLGFDAAAGKTSLSLSPLRVLGDAVALDVHADVLDRSGLSARLDGTAHVALAGLPVALRGVSFDALTLDATARELSWDGARVAGHVDASGHARGLELGADTDSLRLDDVTLLALGTFEPQGGRFHATLGTAAAQLSGADAAGQLAEVSLILGGTTREVGGLQQVEASATLSLDSARLDQGAGGVLSLEQARLHAVAHAPTPELAAWRVPRLELELSAASLAQTRAGRRAQLQRAALSGVIERLARDAGSATGVRGDAQLELRLPTLRVREAGSPALALNGVELTASLPLSLESLKGRLALGSLALGESALGGLSLELESSALLDWARESQSGAQALVRGRLARFQAGGASGVLPELGLRVSRAAPDSYRVELDARGSALAVAGQALPPLTASLRAQAAPSDGSMTLSATLAGARGGALALDARAGFDRASELLRYDVKLSARQLEAFAEAAAGLDRRAAQLKLEGARLDASAHGELTGVLQRGSAGWPEPAPHPASSARGKQSASLALQGLDYRGPGRALRIPKLELRLDSTSGGGGAGRASARLSVPTLELDGGGGSLRLGGLEQTLVASFERAPDQGTVEVDASLVLASAAQSLVPGVPVRDLRLTSHIQIDRLRSIFLRELALDNPASGSSLRAAGTLELLARATPTSADALAGRQALFFEGRLAQQLEPLQHLGLAARASGALEVPFRLQSGGLLGYRLAGAIEAKQVNWVSESGALAVQGLDGTVPVVEEFTLLDGGLVISAGPRTSPLSDTRFFDVHAFLSGQNYVTADSLRIGALQPLGPIAANVRIERSDFLVDQLQASYQGGQIVGQVRVAYRDNDPIVRMRLNATGVRSGKNRQVLDANAALTFVPRALTLDGKVQIVRASREHLEDILDVLDPFHESANANRVRRGLSLGYPKFVRFQLHDGAIDTKVDLGGLAELVRIDEIKAVPLGPILQKYVAPALAGYLKPTVPASPAPEPAADDAEPSARSEREE